MILHPPHELQEALRAFNPRIRVRWEPERNLWLVEERGREDGRWYHVLFWADEEDGQVYKTRKFKFRPLPQTAEPIIRRLCEIDVGRIERLPKHAWRNWVESVDGQRRAFLEAKFKDDLDALREAAADKFERIVAGRRTIELNGTHLPAGGGA